MPDSRPDFNLPPPTDAQPSQVIVHHERRATPTVQIVEPDRSHSLGLTGLWGTLANVSAVVVIAFLTVSMYRDISAEMRASREQFRQDMRDQRDADAKRTEAITTELRSLTAENRALTQEIRASRLSIERAERSITSPAPGGPP